MAEKDRYVFRPVVSCCLLAALGVLVLLSGLKQIMRLDGAWVLLGVALVIVAGFMLTGVYMLSRCAVIMDDRGVRVRGLGSTGDWQEIRWMEVTEVTLRAEPRRGRMGGDVMIVIRSRSGEAIEIIRNEQTQAMLRRYSPVPVPE